MSIASMLSKANHSIAIERPVLQATAMGGRVPSGYTAVATITPCWVQPARADVVTKYASRKIQVTHTIFCGADPQASEDDRVTFGARTLKVVGVVNELEMSQLWRLDCVE